MIDLANASSCAIFCCNDVGTLLQVNGALCRLVEVDADALVHQKVNRIFTIPTQIFFQTHLYPLLKVGKAVEEIFISLKSSSGKEIPVILSGQRTESDGSAINVFSCLTVYQRSNYEAEIISAKKEAKEALLKNSALLAAREELQRQVQQLNEQRQLLQYFNDTLKEISHAVTHELQEPVRKLFICTDLIVNHRQGTVLASDVARLTSQTERIQKILSGLQSYVWLEDVVIKEEQVDLANVLQHANEQLLQDGSVAPFTLTFAHLPKMVVSTSQFRMLFYHLLSNSAKFRHPERPLEVHVEATVLNRNLFQQLENQYAYHAYYRIEYIDNGSGFDPKYSHNIFQLFSQLDKSTPGAGIGLALVKKIVLHHQGTITATGTEGKGSTFTMYLPVEK